MHRHFQFHFGHHGSHGSGRGLGRFGKGFTDGDNGGRAFGMGRKLAGGDLQLLILALLAERPRHGYEIIKALEEKSHGFYVPSPGMVYPSLTYLEEIGHATVATEGTRKLYQLTDAGRQYLADKQATADSLFAQFARVAERMQRVRRALGAEDLDEGGDGATRRGSNELMRARRDLKDALSDKWDSSREEQQRLAGILERATAEILGKPQSGTP